MNIILNPEAFPSPDSWLRFRVSYGETDRMGYVYYGHYPHWFEKSRSQFIRERGLGYDEVEDRGVLLPVRDMVVRYLRPAHFDEEVAVRAAISEWGRASVTFAYQVFGPSDDRTIICAGATRHACVNREGKPIPVPAWLREAISAG